MSKNKMFSTEKILKELSIVVDRLRIPKNILKEMQLKKESDFKVIEEFLNNKGEYSIKEAYPVGSFKTKTNIEYDDNSYDIDYNVILVFKNKDLDLKDWSKFRAELHSFIDENIKNKYMKVLDTRKATTIETQNKDKVLFHIDFVFFIFEDNKYYQIIKISDNYILDKLKKHPNEENVKLLEKLNNSSNSNCKRKAIMLVKCLKKKKSNLAIDMKSYEITNRIVVYSQKDNVYKLIKKFFKNSRKNKNFINLHKFYEKYFYGKSPGNVWEKLKDFFN